MESKIQIDINGDGQPRIKIDYKLSEDIRDRLVGRFLYKAGIPDNQEQAFVLLRLGHELRNGDGACVFIDLLSPEAARIGLIDRESPWKSLYHFPPNDELKVVIRRKTSDGAYAYSSSVVFNSTVSLTEGPDFKITDEMAKAYEWLDQSSFRNLES